MKHWITVLKDNQGGTVNFYKHQARLNKLKRY